MDIAIRTIAPSDNTAIANIVRTSLAEFGANKPGTVFFDPTTDHLYEMFQKPGARYHVAEIDGELVGGGGIYPTGGLENDTCELVKMYLIPSARGTGLGRTLIEKCLAAAIENGYKKIYLETMAEFKQALKVYERFGFDYLKGPMGNSGHWGCGMWMLKTL